MSRTTWTQLADFQGHEINSRGDIRALRTKNQLDQSVNQFGTRYVSLRNTTENKYQNKSVAVLVAETFVPGKTDICETVLHLDGDQSNCNAENLLWVSRWHAIAYHKEISNPYWHEPRRVRHENANRNYTSIAEAAMATACLPSSIEYAIRYNHNMALNEHHNFVQRCDPGGHIFRN